MLRKVMAPVGRSEPECKPGHWEERRVKSGGSRRPSARRRSEKAASLPPFILSLPLLFRFGFYPADKHTRSFQGSRNVLWSEQKEPAYCLWITSLPKATKARIFIENSTFISAAFDYRGKDNNNHKKGPLQSHHPRGIQSGSFRAEKLSLLLSFQDPRQMGF